MGIKLFLCFSPSDLQFLNLANRNMRGSDKFEIQINNEYFSTLSMSQILHGIYLY